MHPKSGFMSIKYFLVTFMTEDFDFSNTDTIFHEIFEVQ